MLHVSKNAFLSKDLTFLEFTAELTYLKYNVFKALICNVYTNWGSRDMCQGHEGRICTDAYEG